MDVHDIDLPILLREKREQVEKKYSEMDRVTFRDEDTYLDLEYTGRLELKIDEKYAVRGVRKTWRDGKTQRVEGLLNDFMVGLVRAAVVKAKREHRFEEARRRRKRDREERRKRKRRAEL